MYKDRRATDSEATRKHNEKENVLLEDIIEDDLAGNSGSLGNKNIDDAVPVTLKAKLRRFSKVSRPPQRYSPSANYLLLTKDSEPQCYPKAI